jgi:cysteine desulfuration protein SufE
MIPLMIAKEEQEIIEVFSLLDNWDDKYEYIIELGKKLPPLDKEHKVDENKIKGCQSSVWLVASYDNGKVYYKADSDSVIVKGLISLLIKVLSGKTPDEILNCELSFIETIGLTKHLAPTRSNGLHAMIKQIKNYALAFKLKFNSLK